MAAMLQVLDRGAHAVAWQVDGKPVLFSSSLATSNAETAWRGGVPICAPWFAAGPDGNQRPSHGPARTSIWQPLAVSETATRHRLEVGRDAAGCEANLELIASTTATGNTLVNELTITNRGEREAVVEAALHTYLQVSDVTAIALRGLEHCRYFDKAAQRECEAEPEIEFGALVDRIYELPGGDVDDIVVVDAAMARQLKLRFDGARQAVVWNCGPDAAPADLGVGQWRNYVCVEAAALGGTALSVGTQLVLRSQITVVAEAANGAGPAR